MTFGVALTNADVLAWFEHSFSLFKTESYTQDNSTIHCLLSDNKSSWKFSKILCIKFLLYLITKEISVKSSNV